MAIIEVVNVAPGRVATHMQLKTHEGAIVNLWIDGHIASEECISLALRLAELAGFEITGLTVEPKAD